MNHESMSKKELIQEIEKKNERLANIDKVLCEQLKQLARFRETIERFEKTYDKNVAGVSTDGMGAFQRWDNSR